MRTTGNNMLSTALGFTCLHVFSRASPSRESCEWRNWRPGHDFRLARRKRKSVEARHGRGVAQNRGVWHFSSFSASRGFTGLHVLPLWPCSWALFSLFARGIAGPPLPAINANVLRPLAPAASDKWPLQSFTGRLHVSSRVKPAKIKLNGFTVYSFI